MSQDQQYWLPGYGLSRHIVLSQIQYFLGPTASARPYSLQGREGYLIVGTPLTRDQIDDLKNLSQQYERQAAIRMTPNSSSSDNTNGNSSEPYINQLIPVGQRDRDRDRERERERDRTRDRRKGPSDHWSRHDRT